MAMTAPAMPPAASVPESQTAEEKAEGYRASYNSIKGTLQKNRAAIFRGMGPYFRSEKLHEPLIPRCAVATRATTNQDYVADDQSRSAAILWHSVLYSTEEEIPSALRDVLVKFGVTEPSDAQVTLAAVQITTMMTYYPDDQSRADEAVRLEFLKAHSLVYPFVFRKIFNSVTSELTRHNELILGDNFRREKGSH